MIFDPILPMPFLGLLLIASVVLLVLFVWNGSAGLLKPVRFMLVAIYVLADLAVFAFLANPGTSRMVRTQELPVFLVVADKSSSMAVPDGDGRRSTRAAVAGRLARDVANAPHDRIQLEWAAVHHGVLPAETVGELAGMAVDGSGTELTKGLLQLVNEYRSGGRMLSGILVLSDGRETVPHQTATLVRLAASQGTPIHTVAIGGDWTNPDIEVQSVRSLVNGFEGTSVTLGARIVNTGMGDTAFPVLLKDGKGNVVARNQIELKDGQSSLVQFTVKCGGEQQEYGIEVPPLNGEANTRNNRVPVSLRIMTSPIRVFMAEGAPYWDSKFLAQLLRQQPVFNVKSVHRLTDNRYFQLNTDDDSDNAAELDGGLPTTLEDFRQFDMIVLGKGMEHLITPERARALESYVRDMGGLLIFARGKSYGGDFGEFKLLEPFIWKNVTDGEHRFLPSTEGEDDNLFGQVLPGKDEPVWESLPLLTDVWDIDTVKPFTRILARSDDGKTPMLAVSRVGLGAVLIVNGDGMWKWDFFPEAKRWGNCYEDFWTQLLQWTQTSSEFMPGYDLSLRVERTTMQPRQPVGYRISWRGRERPDAIRVRLFESGSENPVDEQNASFDGEKDGLPRWSGSLNAPDPGDYILRASIPGNADLPMPEVKLHIPSPSDEQDNLNADAACLAALSEATGGRFMKPDQLVGNLADMLAAPDTYEYTEEVFTPCWNQWYLLVAVCGLLSLGWWVRRRHGLL